jgi:uncharacterized protein YeaO (DUF488 family)
MLTVYTSTIRCADPDRFDITRGTGGRAAAPFAPSWGILKPALAARDLAKRLPKPEGYLVEAAAWDRYVPAFLAEMEHSQLHHPGAWEDLLARSRVVLCCFCPDVTRCHRSLVAQLLKHRGARWEGEIGRDGRWTPAASLAVTSIEGVLRSLRGEP